jgi:uncharacterized protein involved in outer membrane biogenesis
MSSRRRYRSKPGALRRAAKILGIVLGVFLILIIGAVAAVYFYVQANGVKQLTERASAALGRPVTIDSLNIDWGRTTHVTLNGVTVDNVDWASSDHFLESQRIDFDIRLWPLLLGNFELPKLILDQPKLFLERKADGETNWSFGAQPAVNATADIVAPEEREEAPAIDFLDIKEGQLQYKDAAKKLVLDGALTFGTGDASGPDAVNFKGEGELEGRPLKVTFSGGSFNMLKNSEQPYPLTLSIRYGNTAIDVEGTAKDPIAIQGTDLMLKLSGPDLADVFPVLGVPLPPTPPYKLAGQLLREGEVWKFENFDGVIGDSDMHGSLQIDYGREKPFLTAKLDSKLLDLDDLGPLIGLPPKTEGGEAASAEQKQEARNLEKSDNIFPDLPLNVDKLKVMDMDVTLVAKEVHSESYLAVTSFDAHIKVNDGRAVVDPIKLGVAQGGLSGKLTLDSNTKPATVAADVDLSKLDLATFFKSSKYFDTTSGKVDGRLDLTGNGRSLADVMGTADGEVRLVMNGGAISWLLVELAGLDLGQALILYITEDNKIPVRCTAGRILFSKGEATFAPFIMDTTDSVLYVRGVANMKQQTMKIEVEADAKDFSLLDIDAPVEVEGKIRDPKISIGPGVPLPLIEPGDAKNIPCGELINTILTDQ